MIYGKLWLVVKPTVGIPLFLSAVAIGSFAVHVALLTNTTWVKRFLNGAGSGGGTSQEVALHTARRAGSGTSVSGPVLH
jgi:light-harvesting protein B-800-850 alpha chain